MRAARPFLYASSDFRHLFVNFSMTLSSSFLLLKDPQLKRLHSRLTRLQPLINVRKNIEGAAIPPPAPQLVGLSARVNFMVQKHN